MAVLSANIKKHYTILPNKRPVIIFLTHGLYILLACHEISHRAHRGHREKTKALNHEAHEGHEEKSKK